MEYVNVFIICLYEWHLGIFCLLSVFMNGICECFYYQFIWMASGNIFFAVCIYEWNLWMFLSSVYMNGIWVYFLYCLFIWMESVNVFFIAFCWIKMESVNVFFIVFYMNDFCGCFLRHLYIWMESVNVFSTDCFVEWNWWCFLHCYRIGGVMLSVLPSSAVDRGFEPRSGQTKVYAICICCFFAKHAALRGPNHNPTPNNNPNRNISIVTKWKVMDTARWLLQYLTSGSTKVDSTRSRTGWLWIRIMCPNREACLSADCYFFVRGL